MLFGGCWGVLGGGGFKRVFCWFLVVLFFVVMGCFGRFLCVFVVVITRVYLGMLGDCKRV